MKMHNKQLDKDGEWPAAIGSGNKEMAETGNMNAIMTAQTGVQRTGEGVHGLKRMTKMTSQTQKKVGLNNNPQAQTKEARTFEQGIRNRFNELSGQGVF